jgi:hypothetical protein
MSCKGDCWDNAPMKASSTPSRPSGSATGVHATRDQARRDLFQYIEGS